MFTPRSIIPILLIGGLVVIEVLAGNPGANSAQSQRQLSQNETDLILSILHGGTQPEEEALATSLFPFIELDLPSSPGSVSVDTRSSYSTVIGTPTYNPNPLPALSPDSALSEVLPPFSSPLYYAYQDGGVAWYSKSTNVLVIFPDETIRSFDTGTGEETDWLQDKLARLPINDPGAYTTYQSSYKAKIVAQTKTWVLMEFPSGGVMKVSKPQYSTSPSGTIFGLPNILPNSSP